MYPNTKFPLIIKGKNCLPPHKIFPYIEGKNCVPLHRITLINNKGKITAVFHITQAQFSLNMKDELPNSVIFYQTLGNICMDGCVYS